VRHVSHVVPILICIVGSFTLLGVLYVVFAQPRVFPDRVPRYMWAINAHGLGATTSEALANLLQPQQRASDFLESNGFARTSIAIGHPTLEKELNYPGGVTWNAYQDIAVPADTYARFARLSNRLDIYQKGRNDLSWSFPRIPFEAFANLIAFSTIALLCLSAVSLETRSADVARAPRGMHPVIVAIQTVVSGLLVLISLVEAHLLPLLGPRVLAIILGVGLISLGAWLYKTRDWWKDSRFLRYAYACYLAAFAAILGFGTYALTVPVT